MNQMNDHVGAIDKSILSVIITEYRDILTDVIFKPNSYIVRTIDSNVLIGRHICVYNFSKRKFPYYYLLPSVSNAVKAVACKNLAIIVGTYILKVNGLFCRRLFRQRPKRPRMKNVL